MGCEALEFASKELRGDREVVLKAVAQNGDVRGSQSLSPGRKSLHLRIS